MLVKAELLHKSKLILNSGLVEEIVIWRVPKNKQYPDGIKYRLLLTDPVWKKVLILFDNHYPKGHHRHDSDEIEHACRFISVQLLVQDFLKEVKNFEEQYEGNEN